MVFTCVMLCEYQFNFCCLEGMFSKPEISVLVRLKEITGKVCKCKGDVVGFMGQRSVVMAKLVATKAWAPETTFPTMRDSVS